MLPLALKCSALNNLALAMVLHHFYNTRLSVNQMDDMDNYLVTCVRELFDLYKSTTQIAIFLPRQYGGLGIKKISSIYYSTRLSFLVKMLNHEVPNFKHIARESLHLDMKKRNVSLSEEEDNFLGYEVVDGFLKTNTNFGCQSDWPEMLRYARKLEVKVTFVDNIATVTSISGTMLENGNILQNMAILLTLRLQHQPLIMTIKWPAWLK